MGKVNLGVGNFWEEYTDGGENETEDNDFTAVHGAASVNVPYNDIVNLQFDVFGAASMDNDGVGEDNYYGGSGIGAHLNYRDQTGALGVFASVGRANVGSDDSSDYVVFVAGLEGQYFCNQWTLRAQAGWLDSDDNGSLIQEAGLLDVGADYYASNKLKLSGSVGLMDGATSGTDDPDDVTQWNWTLGVEYLFGKSIPVSAYAEYRGQNTEREDGGEGTDEVDSHAVNLGVRFYFGGDGDLMKADREGAGMTNQDIITRARYDVD
jgi:predicted porin